MNIKNEMRIHSSFRNFVWLLSSIIRLKSFLRTTKFSSTVQRGQCLHGQQYRFTVRSFETKKNLCHRHWNNAASIYGYFILAYIIFSFVYMWLSLFRRRTVIWSQCAQPNLSSVLVIRSNTRFLHCSCIICIRKKKRNFNQNVWWSTDFGVK